MAYTLEQLVMAAKLTHDIDGTTITNYLAGLPDEVLTDDTAFNKWSFKAILEAYLIWANGPDWINLIRRDDTKLN